MVAHLRINTSFLGSRLWALILRTRRCRMLAPNSTIFLFSNVRSFRGSSPGLALDPITDERAREALCHHWQTRHSVCWWFLFQAKAVSEVTKSTLMKDFI